MDAYLGRLARVEHNFATLRYLPSSTDVEIFMKRTSPPRTIARSLTPGSSLSRWSLLSTLCYTRSSSLTSSSSTSSRTPGQARESTPAIASARSSWTLHLLICSGPLFRYGSPHTHAHRKRKTNVHTYTHTRTHAHTHTRARGSQAHAIVAPPEEIGSTISSRGSIR